LRGKLGLLSDGLFGVQKMKLQALSLNSMFDAVIFSGEIGKEAGKPNPATFRIMLERLGLVGQQAVYVGDNPLKDFPGAKKNGMGTIRLRLPDGLYSEKEPPDEEYAPELEFSDLAGLEKHLLELVSVKRE